MFTSISIQYSPPDAIYQEEVRTCLCTNTVNNENLKIFNQLMCDLTQNAPRHGAVGDAGANHAYAQVTRQPTSFCSASSAIVLVV